MLGAAVDADSVAFDFVSVVGLELEAAEDLELDTASWEGLSFEDPVPVLGFAEAMSSKSSPGGGSVCSKSAAGGGRVSINIPVEDSFTSDFFGANAPTSATGLGFSCAFSSAVAGVNRASAGFCFTPSNEGRSPPLLDRPGMRLRYHSVKTIMLARKREVIRLRGRNMVLRSSRGSSGHL